MNNALKIISVAIVLLISCNENRFVSEQEIVFSQFPKEVNLIFNNSFRYDKDFVNSIILTDSTILVKNSNGVKDYFFYEYSLKKNNFIGKYFKGGRKWGEALGPVSVGIYKNNLWMYDVTLSKVLISNLSSYGKTVDSSNVSEYPISDLFYSVQLLDSLRLLTSGSFSHKSKLQIFDLITRDSLNRYGIYDNVNKSVAFNSWKMAYQSFLFLKCTGDQAVLACRLTDQIEIFDFKTNKTKIIKGPENYAPEFTPIKSNGFDMITRNEKSRFAFVNGMTTKKYIYLLYSGNIHSSHYMDNGKYIYVYDWKGNPISKLNLDRYVSSFAVTQNDSIIYAYDIKTKFIVKTKILTNDR
jgi:hypothetical protein